MGQIRGEKPEKKEKEPPAQKAPVKKEGGQFCIEIDFTFPCKFLSLNSIFDLNILVYYIVYNFSMQSGN